MDVEEEEEEEETETSVHIKELENVYPEYTTKLVKLAHTRGYQSYETQSDYKII